MTDLLPLRVRSSVIPLLPTPPPPSTSRHPSSAPLPTSHPRLFSAFLFCPPHQHLLLLATPHPHPPLIPPSPLLASILGVIVSLLERGFALVGRTDAER